MQLFLPKQADLHTACWETGGCLMSTVAGEVRWEQTRGLDCPQPRQLSRGQADNGARGRQPKRHISVGVRGAEQANPPLCPAPAALAASGSAAGPRQVCSEGGNVSPLPLPH